MRVTILGSGSAFAESGLPAAIVVDGRLLVDCGAPVHVAGPRAGVELAVIDTVLLTHFHADHCFQLPLFAGARGLSAEPRPLRLAGPPGTAEYVARLIRTGYGASLLERIRETIGLEAVVLQDGLEADLGDHRVHAHAIVHSTGPSLAYCITDRDGVTLLVCGDTSDCAGLRRGLAHADAAVVECTGWHAPQEGNHLWREEVEALVRDHPRTRFVLSHLDVRGTMPGAITAHDGLTLEVRRRAA